MNDDTYVMYRHQKITHQWCMVFGFQPAPMEERERGGGGSIGLAERIIALVKKLDHFSILCL